MVATDPNGELEPLTTAILVAAVAGAVIGGGVNAAVQCASGAPFNWGSFGAAIVTGAVSGAAAPSLQQQRRASYLLLRWEPPRAFTLGERWCPFVRGAGLRGGCLPIPPMRY